MRSRLLIDGHFDFVWRSARRLGLSASDADDVAEEVFGSAARRIDEVDALRERSFLFGALLGAVSARRRRVRGREEAPRAVAPTLELTGRSPESTRELLRVRPLLQELLETLSESQRVLFVLYEIEELELSEIAELLELPIDRVASQLEAGRASFVAAAQRVRVQGSSAVRLVPGGSKR